MVIKKSLILALLILVAMTACYETMPANEKNFSEENSTITIKEGPIEVDKGREISEEDYSIIVTGVEGEVIELNPEATDPDGDTVEYEFSKPIGEDGKWATKQGDEGDYLVTIKAFDGVTYTAQDVLVRVLPADRPPVMNCPSKITVQEGEEIKIDCGVFDPEGNEVIVIYRGFMTTSRYQTTYDDAGKHKVVVTAWDKENVEDKVQDDIMIEIKNFNREPTVYFNLDSELSGMEGDLINIEPRVEDPDGDDITVAYSEPFNSNGEWQTEIGDAGLYNIIVSVNDGDATIEKEFTLLLEKKNTAPQVEKIKDVYVNEGETVELSVEATDREEDYLDIRFKGFMNKAKYTTTYDDAHPNGCSEKSCTAKYTVTVVVSDGELETSQDVTVHVKDQNRPPVFKVPA